jgi:hypothetical protein
LQEEEPGFREEMGGFCRRLAKTKPLVEIERRSVGRM